jgi:hypothetical protein
MPTFAELASKQSGIDAKLARGIEEDHDWRWVEGPNDYTPSTRILDGWTIVAYALPERILCLGSEAIRASSAIRIGAERTFVHHPECELPRRLAPGFSERPVHP